MKFTKMHGIGNDYIYINAIKEKIDNPSFLSKALSKRHFGIGSDGLVLIDKSNVADFQMRMFNADGSEAEMCGNAIRCVGKYVYDNKMTDKKQISIETLAGIKYLTLNVKEDKVDTVKVDMGEPILKSLGIPVDTRKEKFINELVYIKDTPYYITCISMGNPHAVVFLDNVKDLNIEKVGPSFESYPLFLNKTNTEFIKVIDQHTLEMRVWERGAGETLACGTGACASVVAAVLCGYTESKVEVKLLGGSLMIEWNQNSNKVYMTGEATKVFEGEVE